jgi:hypothetical protein
MTGKPLIDISTIEKNERGHCRPALLRRAVFEALGVHDREDGKLFAAMREAGISNIPATNSESLFANASKNREWAEAIAKLVGISIYTLWPNQFALGMPHCQSSGMTPNEQRVLAFISQYIRDHGRSPSYNEIGKAVGSKSRGQSHDCVKSLIRQGKLRRGQPGKMGNLFLINPLEQFSSDILRAELARRGELAA